MQQIDIDKLMRIQIQDNYKELCDKIKLQFLDILINYTKKTDTKTIHLVELEFMKDSLNAYRNKEKDQQINEIANTINDLLNRYDKDNDIPSKIQTVPTIH